MMTPKNQEEKNDNITEKFGYSIKELLTDKSFCKTQPDITKDPDYAKRIQKYSQLFKEIYDYAGPGIYLPGTETYVPLQNCVPLYEELAKKTSLSPEQKKDILVLKYVKKNEQYINDILSNQTKMRRLFLSAYNADLVEGDLERTIAMHENEFEKLARKENLESEKAFERIILEETKKEEKQIEEEKKMAEQYSQKNKPETTQPTNTEKKYEEKKEQNTKLQDTELLQRPPEMEILLKTIKEGYEKRTTENHNHKK